MFSSTKWTYVITVAISKIRILEAPGVNIAYSRSHSRICNARQSEAASDAASVLKYEVDVCGHGGHAHGRYLRGPNFANTQCGAVQRRIPLGSRLQAPNTYHSRRRACKKRESSRRRRKLVCLRALFSEYAMQGALPPHPTLLAFTNLNQAYAVTVDQATSPIFMLVRN